MATDPNQSSQAEPRHEEPIDAEIVRSRDAAIVIAVVVALLAVVARGDCSWRPGAAGDITRSRVTGEVA